MTLAKHGLKAPHLAILAVLGLMAFGVSSAQAQLLPNASTPGLFLVLHPGSYFKSEGLGENLKEGIPLQFVGIEEVPFKIIVPGRGITIGCEEVDVIEGELYGEVGHATILLLKCTVWQLIKEAGLHKYGLGAKLPCVIPGGQIPGKVKFKPILHNGETFVLFEALEGQVFKLVQFQAGTGCPLPLHQNITGSLGALILQLSSNPQLLTFSPEIQLLLGDRLFYGAFEAFYDGALIIEVIGPPPFAGVPWGAH